MDIVIHVGMPKAGSKSLQTRLQKLYCTEEPGEIWYPQPKGKGPSHRLLSTVELKNLIKRAEESGKCKKLVISSEYFAARLPNMKSVIESLKGRANVHLQLVLRPLCERIPSAWQEMHKAFGNRWAAQLCRSTEDSLSIYAAEQLPNSCIDEKVLKLIADSFPQAKFSVLVMEPKAKGNGLFHKYEEATGISLDIQEEKRGDRQNVALTFEALKFLRSLNATFTKRITPAVVTVDVLDRFRGVLAHYPEHDKLTKVCLPESWNELIHEKYAPSLVQALRNLEQSGRCQVFGNIDDIASRQNTVSQEELNNLPQYTDLLEHTLKEML